YRHYQCLCLPGCVPGLGVKLREPPDLALSIFMQGFWVEVPPGLAIDSAGNPIVVEPEPVANRIYPLVCSTPLPSGRGLYRVVRYVAPAGLAVAPAADRRLEDCRFDQRLDALAPQDTVNEPQNFYRYLSGCLRFPRITL
ncbi:MAG: hypothetical protein AAGG53_16145, partial [Cyanobacteria bacterium P01_H01_bin.152]